MANIPPIAYIIIGVVMSAFSKFVEATSGSRSLTIFFYIGIVFVFIGIGKMVLGSMKEEHKPRHHHHFQHQQPQHRHVQHNTIQELKGHHKIAPLNPAQNIVACPRCGTRHYAFARFCMHCGQQLRMN